jgi:hypothetical protein
MVASGPGLVQSGELERLKVEIEALRGSEITAERWRPIFEKYQRWEQGCPGMSRTNRRLQLLKIVSEAFPELGLRANPRLIDTTLADLRKPGETITATFPDGRVGPAQIIRREITERLGVLYTLESQEGSRFTHEFFD